MFKLRVLLVITLYVVAITIPTCVDGHKIILNEVTTPRNLCQQYHPFRLNPYAQVTETVMFTTCMSTTEMGRNKKNDFIKTAAIYGLEWLGTTVVTGVWSIIAPMLVYYPGPTGPPFPPPPKNAFILASSLYVGGNTLLGGLSTWGIGKLLKQRGSLWRACFGACIGSVAGSLVLHYSHRWSMNRLYISQYPNHGARMVEIVGLCFYFFAPSIGAVIGYNWGR